MTKEIKMISKKNRNATGIMISRLLDTTRTFLKCMFHPLDGSMIVLSGRSVLVSRKHGSVGMGVHVVL